MENGQSVICQVMGEEPWVVGEKDGVQLLLQAVGTYHGSIVGQMSDTTIPVETSKYKGPGALVGILCPWGSKGSERGEHFR